ncbi:MAG: lipase maturation factor family protein [Thermoanaerobaculia bacterium]
MVGTHVAAPPSEPTMLFDGDCGFCRFWVERWKSLLKGKVVFRPYQEAGGAFPEIPTESFRKAIHLVEGSGEVSRGAEAVFRALEKGGQRWPLAVSRRIPGCAAATELAYRWIAAHRDIAAKATTIVWGKDPSRPTYARSTWLFLRILGAISLAAFVSLGVQVDGLIGENGILPARTFLQNVSAQVGARRFWLAPTLCWISASNGFLHGLCIAGAILSLALLLDVAPALCAFLLWALSLSLCVVGQEFLGFQWDSLLLEALFLGIFLAPLRLRRGPPVSPPRTAHRLARWLLFRLMFLSGVVKLASGDPTWRNLTALQFHYETQPLPTWIGWYAGHLPAAIQKASAATLFGIELAVPFLVFAPRRLRNFGLGVLVALQVAIGLTGNYAFFNFLAIALCLLACDDQTLPGFAVPAPPLPRRWPRAVLLTLGAVILAVSAIQVEEILVRRAWPAPAAVLAEAVEPFRTINSYGLFAVMTTTRPEIVVEGSADGENWKPYEFRWKPGNLARRPRFVEPHQPRLDWQMWFAALGSLDQNPWFESFLGRLLEGSPDVLRLLKTNPFPDAPPRYVRALAYDYKFTSLEEKRRTGMWWKRELLGAYSPVFSKSSSLQ